MIDHMQVTEEDKLCYDAAYALMQQEIRGVLTASPLVVRQYMQHLLGAQGKYIRAKSLLSCALDKENRIDPNAVKFAAATEILHLATLVHDDVIDNADIRRGIPSLQKKFGRRAAVICGDYLFSLAFKVASEVRDKQDYLKYDMPDTITQICFGELSQYLHNGDLDLDIADYLRIISGKTAALFEASFFVGALLSGCDQIEAKRYKHLGWYAGMIFQLIDDCNDYEQSQENVKKSVQSDFEQNVITLPLIHALHCSDEFREKVESGKITKKELQNGILRWDGLQFAHSVAERFFSKALNILEKLDVTDEKWMRLMAVLARTKLQ